MIANRDIVQDIYSIAVATSTLSQQTGETKRETTLSIPYFEICGTGDVKLYMCQRLHNLRIVLRKYLSGTFSHSRVSNGHGGNICYFCPCILYDVWGVRVVLFEKCPFCLLLNTSIEMLYISSIISNKGKFQKICCPLCITIFGVLSITSE